MTARKLLDRVRGIRPAHNMGGCTSGHRRGTNLIAHTYGSSQRIREGVAGFICN
jgi:hypothetical protein